jgi:hypothetical protein
MGTTSGGVARQRGDANSDWKWWSPDGTWSDWSNIYKDPTAIRLPVRELVLFNGGRRCVPSSSPAAAWAEDSAALSSRNVAPEVLSITALPIGVGLQQVVQATVDPNVESSGMDSERVWTGGPGSATTVLSTGAEIFSMAS